MSAKKSKKTKKDSKESGPFPNIPLPKTTLKKETKETILGVLLFILAITLTLGILGGGGLIGASLKQAFTYLFGILVVCVPIIFLYFAYILVRSKQIHLQKRYITGSTLFLFSFLGLLDISAFKHTGGILGAFTSSLFGKLFGVIGSVFFLGAVLVISLLVLFNERPNFVIWFVKIKTFFKSLFNGNLSLPQIDLSSLKLESHNTKEEDSNETDSALDADEQEAALLQNEQGKGFKKVTPKKKEENELEEIEAEMTPKKKRKTNGSYVFPPLSLLERDSGKPNTGDTKANANIIKRTLQNFGIEVEMDEITVGPTVTRYALKPAEGMKLSRIVALQSDLALALAAHPLRIEAPIPGKALVGIEIPNKSKSIIGFGTLLTDEQFKKDTKPLIVALGKNISGRARFVNLAKMPHGLIAGATGSGKSVTIHALITSLLYRNTPEDLKFIFVDPKRVELTAYNGIPHLLTPVITDPKKAIMALKWAAKEMDKRYDILEANKVRDIASYHENVYEKLAKANPDADKMPYIVIVIDELADIMQAYPRELESGIVRLAQMSRAVGIHLILSTQRPSVNVITGLIKANVPARVALQVASQIDSRTIIDQPGAEKLLGAGDMLYSSGEMSSPERIQCAYISEEEVRKVVTFIKENNDILTDEINLSPAAIGNDNSVFGASIDSDGESDELYEDARQTVIESGKASTSYLQRKLGIGYARAAKLIDILEERGIVGPGNGAKPRDVLEKRPDVASEEFI